MIDVERHAGDHDDRNRAGVDVRRDFVVHIQAAQIWQHQVEHDEVRRLLVDLPQGMEPIGRFANEVPRQRERRPKGRAQIMVVLDDQDRGPALEELRVRYNRYIQAIFSLSPETSIACLGLNPGIPAAWMPVRARHGNER